MKLLLVVILLALAAATAQAEAFNHRRAQRFVVDRLESGRFGELADQAFDAMFNRAAEELRERGHDEAADELVGDWERFYRGVLSGERATPMDTGDHFPFSEWVQTQYAKLEALLGVQVMEFTHLRDIWSMNFAIPVVFDPHQDSEWCAEYEAEWDDGCAKELERHFAGTHWVRGAADDLGATAYRHGGFAGIVAYWAVWGACTAATWGAGVFGVCGPAGTLAQITTERFIAPPISARLWASRN